MRTVTPVRTRFSDRALPEPHFTEAFVFERRFLEDSSGGLNRTVVFTNVPHLCVKHSPDGFEFSYGGSGPADAALNCIEAALIHSAYRGPRTAVFEGSCFVLAEALYQDFKGQFIADLPEDGGSIPFADVVQWIADAQQFLTEHQRIRLAPQYTLVHPDFAEPSAHGDVWTLAEMRELFPSRTFVERDGAVYAGEVLVARLAEAEYPVPTLP